MWTAPAHAELENCGHYGEYFHDTVSGLYWFDPGAFYGENRVKMDQMATHSQVWNWATSAQVDALVGESAVAGSDLEDVMSTRITTIGSGGPRWLGYYAEADPDGWLLESGDTPDFLTLTGSGYQAGAASMGAGAWLVSTDNPSNTAAVLENYGDTGEYFYDGSTDYYWCDPQTFHGMSRSEIESWLASNPEWRWASSAEVYALAGLTSTDGTALEQIFGFRLTTVASGGPRWVGMHADAGSPDGILLEASLAPYFYLVNALGTQGGTESLGGGAWIVSESDPLPTEEKSWGDVKSLFR